MLFGGGKPWNKLMEFYLEDLIMEVHMEVQTTAHMVFIQGKLFINVILKNVCGPMYHVRFKTINNDWDIHVFNFENWFILINVSL